MGQPANHNLLWTKELMTEVQNRWLFGENLPDIARDMGRTRGSIYARLAIIFGYPYDVMAYPNNVQEARDCGYHSYDQLEDDNEPKGSGMERNIAAMMHNDALTVGVKFQHKFLANQGLPEPAKEYTYVTVVPLAVGDLVVVYAGRAMQVAEVSRVDTVLDIEPNDSREYAWIVQKLDTKPYEAQAVKNEQLKQLIKENYKLTARAQMRDLILNQLDGPAKTQALELLK